MARSKQKNDLMKRLRSSGVRKRTARLFAEATDGRRKPAKRVNGLVDELKKALGDVEDRVSGNSAKRKATAKKAAATRKRNAAKRSASAKKGARTRAKSRS